MAVHGLGRSRRAGRVVGLLTLANAVTVSLAGCGEDGSHLPTGRPTSTQSPIVSAQPAGSVTPTVPPPEISNSPRSVTSESETGGLGPAVPAAPAAPSVPAETAGALGADDVPAPSALGPGWRRYADPGNLEEGYAGNGSWVRARGAAEVVQALIPLGCTGLTTAPGLSVPTHALEATYRGPGGAPGVALVLSYRSAEAAAGLVAALRTIDRSCPAPAKSVGPDDPMAAVVTPSVSDALTLLDRRREYGAGAGQWVWSEAVVRRGSRVALLTVASPTRTRGSDLPDLESLAAALRP